MSVASDATMRAVCAMPAALSLSAVSLGLW
jgi:hypothetical protein